MNCDTISVFYRNINVNDSVAINIRQFYHDLYQFNILNINSFTDIAITLQSGGHLGNMEIRQWKRKFSACQHWPLDSAYPNTPNSDIKPFPHKMPVPS